MFYVQISKAIDFSSISRMGERERENRSTFKPKKVKMNIDNKSNNNVHVAS